MTPAQFRVALATTRMAPAGRTTAAARLVLVGGLSHYQASREAGVTIAAINRAVHRLRPTVRCAHCDGTGRVAV